MKIFKSKKKVGNLCCETTKPTLKHDIIPSDGRFETKIGEIFEKSAKQVKIKWDLARKKVFFGLVF